MTLAALAATACLTIEQEPCAAGETMCLEGVVWACEDDGGEWVREVRCPDGRCEDGRCVLPSPASPDASGPDTLTAGPDGG